MGVQGVQMFHRVRCWVGAGPSRHQQHAQPEYSMQPPTATCSSAQRIATHNTSSFDQLSASGREPKRPGLSETSKKCKSSVVLGATQAGGNAGPVSWLAITAISNMSFCAASGRRVQRGVACDGQRARQGSMHSRLVLTGHAAHLAGRPPVN